MRGVVSAGMVSALEALGLGNGFDAVYGSSAGALNAAYFLAGQAARGTTIYYEDINNRRFIDVRRAVQGRPILDLDFLMGEVLTRRKPLNLEHVLATHVPFSIMATDVATAKAVRFRGFSDARELLTALRAGATMPVLAGEPVVFRGRRLFDASVTEPIPVPTAESDGHTHLLVLLTRTRNEPRSVSPLDRLFVIPRLRRIAPALVPAFVDRSHPYASLLTCIAAGRGPAGRAEVMGIRPLPPAVGRLERRRDRLVAGAQSGYHAVMAALDRT
jgi:predicted patatin/cPLA2 family phospholipase